jgi:hypothetical protein
MKTGMRPRNGAIAISAATATFLPMLRGPELEHRMAGH